MTLKDFIVRKPTALQTELSLILNAIRNLPYEKSKTVTPDNRVIDDPDRSNSSVAITGVQGMGAIDDIIFQLFNKAVMDYVTKFPLCTFRGDQGYNALKYEVGEEYREHTDSSTSVPRVLSGILYLNDDYEGGELEFPQFGHTIKPTAGEIVLFPSNFCFVHKSKPVTKGTKHSVVTWFV